jgi:hypothetical protein
MKNKSWIISGLVFLAVALLLLGIGLSKETQVNAFENIPADLKKVTLYKDPNCGCCEGHAQMYRDAGFDVEVISNQDMNKIKSDNGITYDLRSCHTAMMGDYVVEGHVPLEGIEMLITQRPDIKGIALPGMPIGTPGMPGMKTEVYKIRDIETKEVILEI